MNSAIPTIQPFRELAHREGDGLEVTLFWLSAVDELVVCVRDHREGAYFEVRPARHLALEAFYHPYSYGGPTQVRYAGERLAA